MTGNARRLTVSAPVAGAARCNVMVVMGLAASSLELVQELDHPGESSDSGSGWEACECC